VRVIDTVTDILCNKMHLNCCMHHYHLHLCNAAKCRLVDFA
jgi:hypothetical protein